MLNLNSIAERWVVMSPFDRPELLITLVALDFEFQNTQACHCVRTRAISPIL